MSFTSFDWGTGGQFATSTEAETGTNNTKPVSPYVANIFSKWIMSDNSGVPVPVLFTDIG